MKKLLIISILIIFIIITGCTTTTNLKASDVQFSVNVSPHVNSTWLNSLSLPSIEEITQAVDIKT